MKPNMMSNTAFNLWSFPMHSRSNIIASFVVVNVRFKYFKRVQKRL